MVRARDSGFGGFRLRQALGSKVSGVYGFYEVRLQGGSIIFLSTFAVLLGFIGLGFRFSIVAFGCLWVQDVQGSCSLSQGEGCRACA